MMIKAIFWFSLIILVYTYAGYPVFITILARIKRRNALQGTMDDGRWTYPTVSVIISVYNEEGVIREKIENCLAIDYPKDKLEILIGSDGSTDGTNSVLSRYDGRKTKDEERGARGKERFEGFVILVNKKRRGKPYTINKLVRASKGDILFFTDARQAVEKDALKKLVRNFRDEEIGCVSGELVYSDKSSITGRGIGAYWRYEKYLREIESKVYSMIGATGAIYALRRGLFEALPEDIILDDVYTPLVAVGKGYRAVFDREARAIDTFAEIPREEHRRKIRTLSGNYQIFFRLSRMLNPFRSKLAFQIISHKILRVAAPFFMVAVFLSNLLLFEISFYKIFFILQLGFYGMALVEALFRRRIKRIFGIPYLFCLLNFSALVGLWDFLRNGADVKWEKARG